MLNCSCEVITFFGTPAPLILCNNAHAVAIAICVRSIDSPILACEKKRRRCMLSPRSICHACCATHQSTGENGHPIQNIIVAADAPISKFRMLAADQCPLTLLSGLNPSLLFGLELVSSSPCVIFSMKLM